MKKIKTKRIRTECTKLVCSAKKGTADVSLIRMVKGPDTVMDTLIIMLNELLKSQGMKIVNIGLKPGGYRLGTGKTLDPFVTLTYHYEEKKI